MYEINEDQIKTIKEALERSKHKGYEECSAEVCELITKAVKELNWIIEQSAKS